MDTSTPIVTRTSPPNGPPTLLVSGATPSAEQVHGALGLEPDRADWIGGFDGPYNKVSVVDSPEGNPCGEIELSDPPQVTAITSASKDGPLLSLRVLADMASAPALFNRVPAGKLLDFVKSAGWRNEGRRRYALSCAAKVEQWRLRKELRKGDERYGVPDQLIPWGENHRAPADIRNAATRLQGLAIEDLSGTFRDTASPETKAAFVDMLRGVFSRAPGPVTHDEIEYRRPELGMSADTHTATANAWKATGRTSTANTAPSNLPRPGNVAADADAPV